MKTSLRLLFRQLFTKPEVPKYVEILGGLPVEVIREIALYLPPSSAACFALASRSLMLWLGPQALSELRGVEGELPLFLSLLEKDFPKHFYCHECRRLHPTFGSESPRSMSAAVEQQYGSSGYREMQWIRANRDTLKCKSLRRPTFPIHLILNYTIEPRHIRLAMKRYKYGLLHGIALKNFDYRCISKPDDYNWGTLTETVEAQIIGNELYLRRQISWNADPKLRSEKHDRSFRLCPHLSGTALNAANYPRPVSTSEPLIWYLWYKRQVLCKLSHASDKDCDTCSGIKQCPWCFMEYEITKSDDHTMSTTIWYNLGDGQSVNDQKWMSHVCAWHGNENQLTLVKYPAGSISRAWLHSRPDSGAGERKIN